MKCGLCLNTFNTGTNAAMRHWEEPIWELFFDLSNVLNTTSKKKHESISSPYVLSISLRRQELRNFSQ